MIINYLLTNINNFFFSYVETALFLFCKIKELGKILFDEITN